MVCLKLYTARLLALHSCADNIFFSFRGKKFLPLVLLLYADFCCGC